MKTFLTFIFVLLISFLSAKSNIAQDFPYDKYLPRTLAELTAMDETDAKNIPESPKGQFIIHANPFYSAVRVKFIGTVKSLETEEKEYLKMWQSSLGYDAEILKLFENKYLFKECDKEYWIPVQKQVAAYFPKELKSGDMITLYLMYPGGLKIKPATTWNFLFLVNEFQKYQD
jgi:hypothetical protein